MTNFPRQITRFAVAPLVGFALIAIGSAEASAMSAEATIADCRDGVNIGTATLWEDPSDEGVKEVTVSIKIDENDVLAEGKHAVHIHETGNCTPCGSAGGHFDPGPDGNPSPDGNHPFHAGDLVNIEVSDKGKGKLKTVTSRVTLSDGPLSIFDNDGSAFIIHDFEDTYCPEGEEAGCAGGSRAACGVIVPVN